MRHSIYTVLNSAYMPFAKIFIQSYLKYNFHNCDYIFIDSKNKCLDHNHEDGHFRQILCRRRRLNATSLFYMF